MVHMRKQKHGWRVKTMRNKVLYYTLSFTWGLPMTLIGLVSALALIATGHKPNTFVGSIRFNVGESWGAVSLGIVIISCKTCSTMTLRHEFGHSLQNCVYGFFMPFLIGIPSAIRYWYREIRYWRRDEFPPTQYDDVWFEGQATRWGYNINQYFN